MLELIVGSAVGMLLGTLVIAAGVSLGIFWVLGMRALWWWAEYGWQRFVRWLGL